MQRRAVRGDKAGGVLEVLHPDRDAGQRPGVFSARDALVDRGRLGHRPIPIEGNERVDRRIHRLDARQRVRGEVPGGELLGTDLAGQISERLRAKVHRGRR